MESEGPIRPIDNPGVSIPHSGNQVKATSIGASRARLRTGVLCPEDICGFSAYHLVGPEKGQSWSRCGYPDGAVFLRERQYLAIYHEIERIDHVSDLPRKIVEPSHFGG